MDVDTREWNQKPGGGVLARFPCLALVKMCLIWGPVLSVHLVSAFLPK